MNTKNNRRSQETDEAIIRAAFEAMLMGGKPISRITVREICEIANINRSTFYAHYMDVYDLFEKVEMQMAEMCRESIMSNVSGGFRGMMEGMFRFVLEYKEFYQIYFSEVGRVSHIIELMIVPFQEQVKGVKSSDMGFGIAGEADYHFAFYTAGVTSMLALWLQGNCKETPDQLFDILSRVYGGDSMFRRWMGIAQDEPQVRN